MKLLLGCWDGSYLCTQETVTAWSPEAYERDMCFSISAHRFCCSDLLCAIYNKWS